VSQDFSLNTTLLCFHIPRTPLISLRAIFLFPRLKKRLKGRRQENIEAIQAAATMELTGIPKEAFTSCFQDLQKRWQQSTNCGWNYFEEDRKHLVVRLNFVFFTDSVSELYGQRMYMVKGRHKNHEAPNCPIL